MDSVCPSLGSALIIDSLSTIGQVVQVHMGVLKDVSIRNGNSCIPVGEGLSGTMIEWERIRDGRIDIVALEIGDEVAEIPSVDVVSIAGVITANG